MCIEYKEIERYLHYYAGRFQSKELEHDELVNEAWIGIYSLKIPQFASQGIRWAMKSYRDKQLRLRHRRNTKMTISTIDGEITGNLLSSALIDLFDCYRGIETKDSIDKIFKILNLADRLLVDQRYYQGLTLQAIAAIHGCTKSNISFKLNRILDKLKKAAA